MADESVNEQIKELKSRFHSMMNGPVSASMREKGVIYRFNFGVEGVRLVELAKSIGKSHELAQALWKEDVRECRIMAPMLQPVETFSPDIADIWISSMHYPEEAQYVSMYLFQHLPYVGAKVFEWMADGREMYQLCGFLTISKLFDRRIELSEQAREEFMDQASSVLGSKSHSVSRAAYNALQKFAAINESNDEAVNIICNEHRENSDIKA